MTMQGVSRRSAANAREHLDRLLADPATDVAALGEELFDVVHLLDRAHALRRALADPAFPGDRKSALARSLLGDRVSGNTLDLLDGLVHSHWSRTLDLVDAAEVLAVTSTVTRAEREERLDDLEDELFRFRRIVDGQPRLRAVLADPAVAGERKAALLRELLEDKVTSATLRLVTEVAAHPRGRSFDRGLEEYGRLAAQRRARLIAVVRSAVPLTEEQRSRLAAALAAAYGHQVHLNTEVDPDVMGGLTVRIGDEVIDGTIAGRLDEVRRNLAS